MMLLSTIYRSKINLRNKSRTRKLSAKPLYSRKKPVYEEMLYRLRCSMHTLLLFTIATMTVTITCHLASRGVPHLPGPALAGLRVPHQLTPATSVPDGRVMGPGVPTICVSGAVSCPSSALFTIPAIAVCKDVQTDKGTDGSEFPGTQQ